MKSGKIKDVLIQDEIYIDPRTGVECVNKQGKSMIFFCPGCSSRTPHLLETGWWECEACKYAVSPEFTQTFDAGLVMRKT